VLSSSWEFRSAAFTVRTAASWGLVVDWANFEKCRRLTREILSAYHDVPWCYSTASQRHHAETGISFQPKCTKVNLTGPSDKFATKVRENGKAAGGGLDPFILGTPAGNLFSLAAPSRGL
jgi:hypothetical protein